MAGPGAYWFGKEEADAVNRVMQSGHLFRYGSETDPKFLHTVASLENEFAKYCGAKFALATSSGTASLVASLAALGLQPGDEIIVPAYTFVASYTSCIFLGIIPVLSEIDESLTLDPDDIERHITSHTRAIMPVHMLGNPCDMDRIMAVAKKHKLLVLEDCCQAAGASYKMKKVGTIGDMGAFSLNVFKTINSGDGGLVVTNDQNLYETAFAMHDQGHKPSRLGVEVGSREKRKKFKNLMADAKGFKLRTLNDPDGDCATICTVIFDNRGQALKVSKILGSKTLDESGWHVYANMEHVLEYLKKIRRPHKKGAYPKTDNILSRAMNISIGVVDGGLGAGWGININSSDSEIESAADQFIEACR